MANKNAHLLEGIGKLSKSGVFSFDPERKRFTYFNPAFTKILELDRKLLLQEPQLILRSQPEIDLQYLDQRFRELLSNGSIENVEIKLSLNNIEKLLSCSAYLLGPNEVVGFLSDISRVREHEDYLVNYGARKDALLDMVSQNLTTPLNLSRFTVDLIEKAVKEKKYYKLNAHVRLIREVTSDCIKTIDKFLQEEHLESPSINIKSNRFDAIGKVMIVLEKVREGNPDKLFRVITSHKHLFMKADVTKFFQIVHNLVSNAIKFTKPNGSIEVEMNDRGDKAEVIVRDDGIGIPPDLLPYIFEKKTRAARPGLKGETSSGVGLYVVRTLTELMGGSVSCKSEENKGTTFTLLLPKDDYR